MDRIADIIFRTIPHPTLLFFKYRDEINIYTAHVKIHGSNHSIFTYDDEDNKMIKTEWINTQLLNEEKKKLFDDLKIQNLNNINFYEFYNDMYNAIINYRSNVLKEAISTLSPQEKKYILSQIDKIELKIKELQVQIKKDIPFNELIELNTLVNEYDKQKQDWIKKL